MGGRDSMRQDEFQRRVDSSYEKYGWTKEQRAVFDKFVNERYANFRKPENTLRSYLDLLNQVVLKIKKPFSEITYDDLIPLLRDWQNRYGKKTTIMHGPLYIVEILQFHQDLSSQHHRQHRKLCSLDHSILECERALWDLNTELDCSLHSYTLELL
jgi:hypothetical protein